MTPDEIRAVRRVQAIIEAPGMRTHLKAGYRSAIAGGAHPHTGFCSMASDALRRILGGEVRGFSGYRLCRVVHEGGPHYYLESPSGRVIDPTSSQFGTAPDYSGRRGVGLPTPSRIPGTDVQSPTMGAAEIMSRYDEGGER